MQHQDTALKANQGVTRWRGICHEVWAFLLVGLALASNAAFATPSVTLTAPTHGASQSAPGSISMAASKDASTVEVRIYNKLKLIGTGLSTPFAPRPITSIPCNQSPQIQSAGTQPSVTLNSPTNGATFATGASIGLSATATGGTTNCGEDIAIDHVDFLDGATLIASITTSPYSYTWRTASRGTHTLTAKVFAGGSATSSPVTITVNNPPTVSLTSPINGATATAPASFSLAANASDSDGTISSVAFYAGSTLISTATSAPYKAAFNTSALGTYSLTAVATDNSGARTTSSAVSVTVYSASNHPPTVSLTSPTNGASAAAPATFNLTATATDSDGTISSVKFYADGALLCTATSSPYHCAYTTSTIGTHSLTAVATDNGGAPTTSAPVQVSVTGIVSVSRWITTSATYDSYGNKTSDTDALNHKTSTAWASSYGRLPTSTTDALLRVTTLTPDLTCSDEAYKFDPNNGLTQWTYDGLCRKQTEIRPDGGKTTWSYNAYGSIGSQNVKTDNTDVEGEYQWTASYFDGLGREYQSQNNASDMVVTTYDPRGLVASVSAPGAGAGGPATSYTYDARRQLKITSFPGGKAQSSVYSGWTTTTTDEEGKVRTLTRDAYGQLRQVVESVSSTKACANGGTAYVTTINYDLLGRQVGFTDACGNTSVTTFDSLGRVLLRNDPDMGSWTYKYDDAGRMTTQTDAKGQVITSTFDELNRPLGTTNSKDASSTSFVYDRSPHYPKGRLTTATRVSAGGYGVVTSYDYDLMGHTTAQTLAIGTRNYTTASTYDGMGKVRTMTYPNGEVLTYGYEARGLQNSLSSSAFTKKLVSAANYDPRRNPLSRSLGNGVVESFAYDPSRFWLTGVSASLGTTQVHGVSLGRDGRGLVQTRTNALDPTDNWTYTYDDVRRLTGATDTGKSAWTETFSYDPSNRVVSSSSLGSYNYPAVGSPHVHAPLTLVSPTNVTTTDTYDANGNLLTSGSNSFTYDVENRPTTVNGQATGYDAAGTRVYQGSLDFVGGDTYDFDTSTNLPTRYYYFNGARIASAQGVAQTFYHGDQLNSATTLTGAAGNVLSRQVLSPFGRRLAASTDRIALAGVRLDTTGLYTMGAREMHPNLGLFITPDPSGAPDPERPQTLNRYAYANNSPTNLVDLTGFAATDPSLSQEPSPQKYCGRLASTCHRYGPQANHPIGPIGEIDSGTGVERPKTVKLDRYSALEHYKQGTGTPLRIDFGDVDTKSVTIRDFKPVEKLISSDKQGNFPIDAKTAYTTKGEEYYYLADITLRLQGNLALSKSDFSFKGTLKSYDDVYDFNASTHRSIFGEALTAFGRSQEGKAYPMEIRGSKSVSEEGSR